MRWAAMAWAMLAAGCGNEPAKPTTPLAVTGIQAPPPAERPPVEPPPRRPADLAAPANPGAPGAPDDPTAAGISPVAAPPLPSPPPSVPMVPGLHPILAFTRALEGPHAFLLACVQIVPNKPTRFLGGKACAPLLKKADLELVLDASRVAVKLGTRSKAIDCPWADEPRKIPTFKLAGLPAEREGAQFIVSKGTVENRGPVPDDVMKRVRANAPLQPTKRGLDGPTVTTQFDLDGDGSFEVIMSMGGDDLEIFRADGTSFGTVGCYFG